MSESAQNVLPEDVRKEIARLYREGFPLLPLGGGGDGKKPVLRGWADKTLTLSQVFGPMYSKEVAMYAVRLDGMAVVDCDIDAPDLVSELEARFGPSPVHVKTPRGRHLYYLANGKAPNLRKENVPVDIKTGSGSYVAGPYSIRPDGGVYTPIKGVLGMDALSPLKIPSSAPVVPVASPGLIQRGSRHKALVEFAMQRVLHVLNLDDLKAKLYRYRDDRCETPQTMHDTELDGIAEWAWKCRLENNVFIGRKSAFSIERQLLDILRGKPAQEDALALYVNTGTCLASGFPLVIKP